MTQTWKLAFDDGFSGDVRLPMGPVNSVSAVTLIDEEGASTVLAASAYHLNAARDALQLEAEVVSHRLEITYVCGFGDAQDVPAAIKLGMLSHIAQMYDNRGEPLAAALPLQVAGMYQPFREVRL